MGLEFARQLAARGYDLLLVSNQEQALADAARELSGPVSVRTRFQDLARPEAADELCAVGADACPRSGRSPGSGIPPSGGEGMSPKSGISPMSGIPPPGNCRRGRIRSRHR